MPKALPGETYAAIFKYELPKYQFAAIDIRTRTRFLSFANEFSFMIYVGFMLHVLEVWHKIFSLTDNGTEFGGGGGREPSWKKTS